jgi:parallel beta-helix repeat protein
VRIHDCTLENNRYGVLVLGCDDTMIERNTIRGNAQFGVVVRGGATGVVVRANRFADNGKAPGLRDLLSTPTMPAVPRHIRIEDDTTDVKVAGDNRYD